MTFKDLYKERQIKITYDIKDIGSRLLSLYEQLDRVMPLELNYIYDLLDDNQRYLNDLMRDIKKFCEDKQ